MLVTVRVQEGSQNIWGWGRLLYSLFLPLFSKLPRFSQGLTLQAEQWVCFELGFPRFLHSSDCLIRKLGPLWEYFPALSTLTTLANRTMDELWEHFPMLSPLPILANRTMGQLWEPFSHALPAMLEHLLLSVSEQHTSPVSFFFNLPIYRIVWSTVK